MTAHTTQLCPDDPVTERTPVNTTPSGRTSRRLAVQSPAKSPAALLRRAAELIERYGLYRHAWWPDACPTADGEQPQDYIDGDPCCAIGALAVAAGVWQVSSVQRALIELPVLAIANDALHAAMPPGVAFVAAWNDEPGRTPGEVAEAMRSAAAQLDTCPGGPSAKTFHRARTNSTPNHQDDSKEPLHV